MKILIIIIIIMISDGNFVFGLENSSEIVMNEKLINLEPKVVGGTDASLGDNPAQVSLHLISNRDKAGYHICGGSIINMKHVLSACHCVLKGQEAYSVNNFKIVGDLLHLKPVDNQRQTRKVSHIWAHKGYSHQTKENDIAILRVSKPFIATKTFYSLPRSYITPTHPMVCTLYGWGSQSKYGKGSNTLKFAVLEIRTRKDCKNRYSIFKDTMICAGTSKKNSCHGDSGGGLICNNTIAGIVSFGRKCVDDPGVYTNVMHFNTWIDECLVYEGSSGVVEQPYEQPATATWQYIAMGLSAGVMAIIIFVIKKFLNNSRRINFLT